MGVKKTGRKREGRRGEVEEKGERQRELGREEGRGKRQMMTMTCPW